MLIKFTLNMIFGSIGLYKYAPQIILKNIFLINPNSKNPLQKIALTFILKWSNSFDKCVSKIFLRMLTWCLYKTRENTMFCPIVRTTHVFLPNSHQKFFLASEHENSVFSFKNDSKWVSFIFCHDQTSQWCF